MKTKIFKTGLLAILLAIFVSGCSTPLPNVGGDNNKAASINDLEICISKTPITLNKDTLSEIMEKNKNITDYNNGIMMGDGTPVKATVEPGSNQDGYITDEDGKNAQIRSYNPDQKNKKSFPECIIYSISSNDGAISINGLNKDTFYVDSAFDVLDQIGLSNVKNDKERWIPREHAFEYKTKDIYVTITDASKNKETNSGQEYICMINFQNEKSSISITLSKLNKEMAGILSKEEIKETGKLKITEIKVEAKMPTGNKVYTTFSAPTTSISLEN